VKTLTSAFSNTSRLAGCRQQSVSIQLVETGRAEGGVGDDVLAIYDGGSLVQSLPDGAGQYGQRRKVIYILQHIVGRGRWPGQHAGHDRHGVGDQRENTTGVGDFLQDIVGTDLGDR
jgi:hypothetical protein